MIEHEDNLFYDKEIEVFHGIDLGVVFEHNLSKESCCQILSFTINNFSVSEFYALTLYCFKSFDKKLAYERTLVVFNELIQLISIKNSEVMQQKIMDYEN